MRSDIVVYKDTEESWYPSFQTEGFDLVQVSMLFCPDGNDEFDTGWVVSVCGNDDYSLSKFFGGETEAWLVFLQIIGQEKVTHEFCKSLDLQFDH